MSEGLGSGRAPARERMRPGATLVTLAFVVALNALAAWSLWPVYQSPAFVTMLVVTLGAGILIAVLGSVFRWPSIVVAGAVVVAFLALGVQLAVPSEATASGLLPTAPGLADLVQATWLSWKQLVTISVPVGSYEALLVPAFILTLLSVVVSASVALRARRGEGALVAPIVLLVGGVFLGAAVPVPLWLVLTFFAAGTAWTILFRLQRRTRAVTRLGRQSGLALETPRERRATALRTAVGAAVILVIAGVAGTAAAIALPPVSSRQVLRTVVEQPFDPRDYPSPLSGFRAYLEPPEAATPMLTVVGLQKDRRLRIATLDTYDGVTYAVGAQQQSSASGSFTRVPYRLDQSHTPGASASISVTVRGYRGPWVPGSGQLEELAFRGRDAAALSGSLVYNDVTGTAAVTRGLGAGDGYTLNAVVKPERSIAQLATSQPGSATVPKPTVIPDELASALQKYTAGVNGPGAKLSAALSGLAKDGYISHGISPGEPPSRSGHGADRITQLLTDVPMVGDQEQYAVTAALMARQLGFPARVVVGFVAPADVATGGAVTLLGSDISAWIEVQTREGWVTVDPTPPSRPVPPKQPEQPTQITRPQTNVQPPVDDSHDLRQDPPQAQVDKADQPQPNPVLDLLLGVLRVVGSVVVALAVLASPFLAVVAAKWRRRSLRRRAATSEERIVGGWREFADAATDHGFDPPPAATRRELAGTIGGAKAAALAAVADRAVFSPTAPTAAEADSVWRAVDDLRSQLDRRTTRWGRVAAAVSLRSLGYRGRRGDRRRSSR